MIRFCCYALVAIVVLVGPPWMGLVGEAVASFRGVPIDRHDLTTDFTETSTSGAGAESPATPSDSVPAWPGLRLGVHVPADSGAGTSNSSTHNFSPGGMPGVTPEAPGPAIASATRMRLTQERVAAISRPSSVFEPPRAD